MSGIYDFLAEKFGQPDGARVFFELGAHIGTDTIRLAAFPGVTLHTFEPDKENIGPDLPNVIFNRAAIAAHDGEVQFHPSEWRGEVEWTMSGSIHRPTGHLSAYPDVEFGAPISVPAITLDTYVREHRIEHIDFIWADIQGAERDMILGGREALARTRYLYTEYWNTPLYEGQPSLAEILALVPGWKVLADWPSGEAYADVLLENAID
jgi:FkbM family methyltransferase